MAGTITLQNFAQLGDVLPHAPAKAPPSPQKTTVVGINGKRVEVQRARRVDLPDHLVKARAATPARVPNGRPSFKTQPKPRDFRAALADMFYESRGLGVLEIPETLLANIKTADKILLIGHTHPDHDTVGAVLTLRAALRLLNKDVDVCIDCDDLRITQKRLDPEGAIKRAEKLEGKSWDLAIVCDVGSLRRIAGARKLLQSATAKAVLEHHDPEKDKSDCILTAHGIHDQSWIDNSLDAASLQACAIADRLLVGTNLDPAAARKVFLPALVGIITDTKWGSLRRMSELTPHLFKGLIRRTDATLEGIREILRVDLPYALQAAVVDPRFVKRSNHGSGHRALTLVAVSRDSWNALVAMGKKGGLGESEVLDALKAQLDAYANSGGCGMLVVDRPGAVSFIGRSNDGRAGDFCALVGRGGGHAEAASTTMHGCTLDIAVRELTTKARRAGLIT